MNDLNTAWTESSFRAYEAISCNELAPNQQQTVETLNELTKEFKTFLSDAEDKLPEHLKSCDLLELLNELAFENTSPEEFLPDAEMPEEY